MESAYAALRFGASVALGVPFQRRSLDRLLAAMRAAYEEFGPPADGGDVLGRMPLDDAARRTVQGRRLRTPKRALREDPEAFLRAGARPAYRCSTTGTTARATAVWFSADEVHLFGALTAIGAFQSGTVRADDQVLIAVSARNILGEPRTTGGLRWR